MEYIIVGQGIAGSCLALQLIFRGKQVLVFDQPQLNKSSSVAAGLFNPVIGKVMTRAWKADLLYPSLLDFYPRAEEFLEQRFFHQIPLYRPFSAIFEQNEWMALSVDPFFKDCIDAIYLEPTFGDEVTDPLGGLLVKQSGYLDVSTFVESTRNFLLSINSYREEKFEPSSLVMAEQGFEYKGQKAPKIVFCGGMEDKTTDFFSWLPLRPLKGETLEIELPSSLKRLYNKGVYLAPSSQNHYKVGATYDPKDTSRTITEAAKFELVSKLDELITKPYTIVSQAWGFRPCAGDRKPYLGEHPKIKNMFVFNGLGTKGVSLAPHFSNELTNFMEGKGTIDAEANITRIRRVYH